jgi:hypothetical protein
MINDCLNEDNFLLYAARNYDNPQCYNSEEFYDDLKRFKYLKRLFGKYRDSGELRERLILNHLIVIYNVFGNSATPMLFFKLDSYHEYWKPFLLFLGRMPNKIEKLGNEGITIYSSNIHMDDKVVEVLRKL